MDDREHSVQYFLDLIKKSHRGKFKVYIGTVSYTHLTLPTIYSV